MFEITQERIDYLIDYCIEAGYGWEKYARSVREQGKCSDQQFFTLQKMHNKIYMIRSINKRKYSYNGGDCNGISEAEYMSFNINEHGM